MKVINDPGFVLTNSTTPPDTSKDGYEWAILNHSDYVEWVQVKIMDSPLDRAKWFDGQWMLRFGNEQYELFDWSIEETDQFYICTGKAYRGEGATLFLFK